MTLAEVRTLLLTTGFQVAYHHFDTAQTPPYIVYITPYSRNFAADDKVYQKINHLQIELYTDKKDLAAEEKVEAALDGAEIFWNKTETHIDSEKLYQIIYESEVS